MPSGVKKNMYYGDERKTDYQRIEDISGLKDFVRKLEKEKIIAVDLEADSMYHFQEKVCLIQMATPNLTCVIDPLGVQDLSALKAVFANPAVKKIFHGADYDIRSLYRDFRIEIHHLFDTQLASMFLGEKETSLEAVLQKRFRITLNKKYQRKDWSARPLPEAMFDYAAEDARYLIPLAEILEKELRKKKRLSWVTEECEYLSRVRPATEANNPLFCNFKGAGRLDRRSLAVLEALLQYRRNVARKKDKPLFKILSNRVLLELARAKPVNLNQLSGKRFLSQKQVQMHGVALIKAIKSALKITEKRLPVYPRKKKPALAPDVPGWIKKIKTWRDIKARTLEIDPGLLINKALIQVIAIKKPRCQKDLNEIPEMKNWQRKAFGPEFLRFFKNEKQ